MLRKSLLIMLFLALAPVAVFAQGSRPVRQITDADISGTTTWSKDTVYVLNGFVFVEDGEVLNVQAGTVIKGKPGQGVNASALIVARGGKVYARGSSSQPIIFTAESDDVDNPSDLPSDSRGLWGGLIILGRARINTAKGTGNIEGIPDSEPRGAYGGANDHDNSGVYQYISLRYGGTDIGAGNEINGVTFGAVGDSTVVDHIEVFNNADDGYEWFGGTVNTKYLVSAFNGDDCFDTDEGFTGKSQFWFAIQSDAAGMANRANEADGGTVPEDGLPLSIPVHYNCTYIGSGAHSSNTDNDVTLIFRDNAGGRYMNSVFTDFTQKALWVEDLASGEDSRHRQEVGDLTLTNNIFYGYGAGSTWATLVTDDTKSAPEYLVTYMSNAANHNDIVDPKLYGISRTSDGKLDPRPMAGSPALSAGATIPSDGFYTQVSYKGAFGPDAGDNWLRGWTFLDKAGYLSTPTESGKPVKIIADADIKTNTTFHADTIYTLNGFVFVENGETLNIEAGTVIKGKPGQGVNASALIVARGGKVYARGSSSKPIIFTAESDDVDDPNDLPLDSRGLWGGLILLGRARINTAKGEGNIEGIPDSEPRGAYGGTNDHDNSGVYQYISLRYGGTDIGAGNEINGMTFGAVGDSTVVDHIEVFNNADDGYEWFGGTVNTRYLVSAFNGDDCFDTDEGFNGKSQFWFAIQSDVNGIGNRGGEHDGGTVPEDGLPLSIPVHYNCTYIGAGVGTANVENDLTFIFRDNAGGRYMNSVFTDFNKAAIDVEDLTSGEDSRHRLEVGDLTLTNNIFYGYGAGSTWDKLVLNGATTNAYVATYMSNAANHNDIVDPKLYGISRTNNGVLDPRPKSGSPALSAGAAIPSDGFYTQVSYKGAFGPAAGDNWLRGWTFLDKAGFLAVPMESGKPVKVVADKDITKNTTFYADTIYTLNGFVFVEDGEVLNIQPGTVIKGKPGQGVNASALIVARGGKIYALGTAVKPIIFTAEADNVDEIDDLPLDSRGLWGGVILLGKAKINTAKGTGNIEGIPDTEPRGAYGGTDDHDNSGVMQYVSLRYGGTDIGAGNEINGVTFGAVGDGTTIDHIEVFNNADDGYEWFGGTVNTKYLISAFNADDCFDTDEGFTGKSQFWFAIQSDAAGMANRGNEADGGTVPEDGLPLSIPVHYNCTYIGSGAHSSNTDNDVTLIFRDNAGGRYRNSVFTDFTKKALWVEDLSSGEDSRHRLEVGDLTLTNNIFYGYGAGSTWSTLVQDDTGNPPDYLVAYMSNAANHNSIADPKVRGISRTNDGKLDPRVEFGSPALTAGDSIPSDGFYTQVSYKGAFNGTENWALGWSFLDQAGFLSHTVYQDTTDHDTTGTKKNCDFNLDSKNDVSDVIFMLLLSRSNPTDSRLDWNKDGKYMINDAVDLLLDIRSGNCSGSTVLLAAADGSMVAGSSAVSALTLSDDEIKYLETQIQVMGLTEDQKAEFHVAMYGAGAPAQLPKAFSLSQNSPNPFNPSTTISFAVAEGSNGKVSLKIYDLRGALIRTLIDEVRTPGTYQVFWDGTDNRGQATASGIYFYRMQAGDFVMTRKMVLLR